MARQYGTALDVPADAAWFTEIHVMERILQLAAFLLHEPLYNWTPGQLCTCCAARVQEDVPPVHLIQSLLPYCT